MIETKFSGHDKILVDTKKLGGQPVEFSGHDKILVDTKKLGGQPVATGLRVGKFFH